MNSQDVNNNNALVGNESNQLASAHPVSILGQAERRRRVENLYLCGYGAKAIAEEVGCDITTAQRDLEYIELNLTYRPRVEELRQSFTRQMIGLAEVAERRYRDEGNTVEGRLVIDAVARAAKLQGLDETQTEQDVGGAMAKLLSAIADAHG